VTLFDVEPVDTRLGGDETRVKLVVAYDGAAFRGFWPNAGVATVGGALIVALEQVFNRPMTLTCAGRTDAGVHAWGQVVTFDAPADRLDVDRLRTSINTLCGPAIVVREAAEPAVRRPDLGHIADLPLYGPQSSLPGPVPAVHQLARGRTARPAGHGPRL